MDFIFQDANSAAQRVIVSTDLSAIGSATDFFHVVGVCDVDSAAAGTGWLYVNGVLVDGPTTTTGTVNDWDGGDLAELGKGNNIPSANPFNPDAFTGDIAGFNYVAGQLLSALANERRYQDISGGGTLFQFTEILYDAGADTFRLTWTSAPDQEFGLFYSLDGADWGADVDDAIPSGGETTTYPPLEEPALPNPEPGAPTILFRVERN